MKAFTMKTKLVFLISFMLLSFVLLGFLSLHNITIVKNNINSMYEDRVKPLEQLKCISDAYAVYVIDAAHKVRNGNFSWEQGESSIENARAIVKGKWDDYLKTQMDEHEQQIAVEVQGLMKEADKATDEFQAIIESKNNALLETFVKKRLYAAIDPLTAKLGQLIDIQLESSKMLNAEVGQVNTKNLKLSLLILIVTISFSIVLGVYFIKNISRIIKSLIDETNNLTDLILKGKINTRANETNINFEFREIVSGINQTLDCLVSFLDNLPIPFVIMDKEFNILYINESGAKAGDKKPAELVGTKCYNHFKTADCRTQNCACQKTMLSGNLEKSETVANPTETKRLDISYLALPLKDKSNQITGAFEVVTDLTQIKYELNKSDKVSRYLTNQVNLLVEKLGQFANGELNIDFSTNDFDEFTVNSKLLFDSINNTLNNTTRKLSGIIKSFREVADQIAIVSNELQCGSQVLSQGASEQAAAIEEISSSMEQMTSSINQNSENAIQTEQIAIQGSKNIEEGN